MCRFTFPRRLPFVACLLALATSAAILGCESTGRPTAPKSEARKSPPKWTSAIEIDAKRRDAMASMPMKTGIERPKAPASA